MCVDLHWPTMRFIGFQEDEHDAELDVEVLYPEMENEKERYKWHKVESLKAKHKDNWQPTKDIKLEPERGGKWRGGRPVALRFTNDSEIGTWRIDNRLRGTADRVSVVAGRRSCQLRPHPALSGSRSWRFSDHMRSERRRLAY